MAFFYKHIVPTGLKRVSTNQVTRTKRRTSDKQYFTKSYLAQLVIFTVFFSKVAGIMEVALRVQP